jgi:hypothetical protein
LREVKFLQEGVWINKLVLLDLEILDGVNVMKHFFIWISRYVLVSHVLIPRILSPSLM